MGSTPDGGILPETRRVTMDEATIVKGYQYAKDIYGRAGVDVDRAIELADRIPVSMHSWQGDDLIGFDGIGEIKVPTIPRLASVSYTHLTLPTTS